MRRCPPIVLLGFASVLIGCGAAVDSPATDTSDTETMPAGSYIGQPPPTNEPQVFAPGLVSTGMAERDFAMTPDLDEIYYTSVLGAGFDFSAIVVTRQIDGVWSRPEVADFSGRYKDLEPAISPDGQQFFFVSRRPEGESTATADNEEIWVMDREGDHWGKPRKLGSTINTDQPEFFPSVTRDGTLFFTRRSAEDRTESIFRSRWIDGRYQEPEKLAPEVNAAPTQFNAFIDPDERYIIVCSWGRDDSLGGVDYYIVFRDSDDVWQGPINLGAKINTEEGQEWSPYVSPDGKYFFFMSSRNAIDEHLELGNMTFSDLQTLHREPENGNSDIWWVDASFLEDLRPTN